MYIEPEVIDALLSRVEKPMRYAGGELGSVVKDLRAVEARWALAFPDAYDIGMDNQGIQILYKVLNDLPWLACERVFSPWTDMEALMRERGVPLFTLESKARVADLDVFAISVPYEIVLSNVVALLDLAGLPLWSRDRDARWPLVVGGGTVAYNCEPIADFFDVFVVGEGEEVVVELAEAVRRWTAAGRPDKDRFLEELTHIKGVYVPRFFQPEYEDDGRLRAIRPLLPHYKRVFRRVVADLDASPWPEKPVLPTLKTIHDRLSVEIQRGCTAGCRFCQAGMIYRPTRERSPERVLHLVEEGLSNTGYEGVSLMSLSAGDYSFINSLLRATNQRYEERMISVQVPSLRVKTLTREVALETARVKKGGFTIAPEAGSQRMRDAINKDVTDAEISRTVETIFTSGGQSVKMYFMCGLPGETEEDLDGIAQLGILAFETARKHHPRPKVTVSVSTFVPKPFTPYQWAGQIDREETRRRQRYLRERLSRHRHIQLRTHDDYGTFLEGVFSRGDRRVAHALVEAHRRGCRFDGWQEHINERAWGEAFEAAGIDPMWYLRERTLDEVLPFDHIEALVGKAFLRKEWDRHLKALYIPDCRWGECAPCGACRKEIRITTFDGQDPLGPPVAPGEGRTYHHPVAAAPQVVERQEGGEEEKTRQYKLPWRAVRLRYTKTGQARFIGHLELMNSFIRALRRLSVPLRHSQGFHPHPRMALSNPLPVGVESLWEYIDLEIIETERGLSDEGLMAALNGGQLPAGLQILEVGPPTWPLGGVLSSVWRMDLPQAISPERVREVVEGFFAAPAVMVQGKSRARDARRLVTTLRAEGRSLTLELLQPQEGTFKPTALLEVLLPELAIADVRVTKIGITPPQASSPTPQPEAQLQA